MGQLWRTKHLPTHDGMSTEDQFYWGGFSQVPATLREVAECVESQTSAVRSSNCTGHWHVCPCPHGKEGDGRAQTVGTGFRDCLPRNSKTPLSGSSWSFACVNDGRPRARNSWSGMLLSVKGLWTTCSKYIYGLEVKGVSAQKWIGSKALVTILILNVKAVKAQVGLD